MVLKLSDPLLHLRTITANDEEILCQIYSSTRTEELAQLTDWTASQKEIFLRSQFTAQHNYYQNNYGGAHFWVIEYGSQTIGRLYLHTHYEGASMRIIDIALLPGWRNRGIGKQILLAIMELAEDTNRSVTIHVESFNRAMKLYKGLGFVLVSQTNGVYHLLEWKSNAHSFQENVLCKQQATNGSRTTTFNSL
ncbi:GNAT family N-acetyltransferase [Flavisolibacter ginsenosidimutans]|uniref:GNAT family N-acetyltransferase n=1 Tax=Flavisolibacter ginsenosidimutans TaxID=661481 RepID=A0A5B8UMZ3_9BACT|nr:GNAT family N-acetyltransferase [Flavisolibacter ginsenosidimutans]QEC57933.1 GNAT family N-acetyltransferase [Flavisolibacter ginsenosidimutans]